MQTTPRIRVTALLGLGLLSIPLVHLAWREAPSQPLALPVMDHHTGRWGPPPVPNTPSETALQEARRWRLQAILAVNQERYALEAWDPEAGMAPNQEAWRRQLMASDRAGNLRQARRQGWRAAALARTPREAYRATELLVMVECDAGHHEAEMQEARKLIRLAPRDPNAIVMLEHARRCSAPEAQGASGAGGKANLNTPLTGP